VIRLEEGMPTTWPAPAADRVEPHDIWHGMWAGSLPMLHMVRRRHGGATVYDPRDVFLRSRIYDAEQQRINATRAADRREKVGSGDRSERIRTYNFPQGRVTDHRINLTLYKLPQVIAGEALGELVDALTTEHQAAQLAAQGAAA